MRRRISISLVLGAALPLALALTPGCGSTSSATPPAADASGDTLGADTLAADTLGDTGANDTTPADAGDAEPGILDEPVRDDAGGVCGGDGEQSELFYGRSESSGGAGELE